VYYESIPLFERNLEEREVKIAGLFKEIKTKKANL
jgi:hypothetical protein